MQVTGYTEIESCAQSCPVLWDSMAYSPPGSSIHGVSQARILKRVTIPSSSRFSQPREWTWIPCAYCIAGRIFTAKPFGKPLGESFRNCQVSQVRLMVYAKNAGKQNFKKIIWDSNYQQSFCQLFMSEFWEIWKTNLTKRKYKKKFSGFFVYHEITLVI